FKNMAYGLKIRRMPKTEIERRVLNAAKILELTDFLNRKPRELSGGQRQRVAMGRCIVREPKAFLFDEPLSNLDAKLRVQMRLEIRKLHENLRITSIYVTHDQVEAMTLGDRLLIMDKGFAEQIGSPLEVYKRPSNTFVAGFIGSPAMNFFEGSVSQDGKEIEASGMLRLPLPMEGIPEYRGKPVLFGIRPEHLALSDEGSGQIHCNVDHTEMLGADTLVHGYLPDRKTPLTLRLSDIYRIERNAGLVLSVSPEKLHLFDKENKKRIGNW
ncbi:MAG: ATP-binding cassette domain-containing protein, partial [Pseudomonadota bacterium]